MARYILINALPGGLKAGTVLDDAQRSDIPGIVASGGSLVLLPNAPIEAAALQARSSYARGASDEMASAIMLGALGLSGAGGGAGGDLLLFKGDGSAQKGSEFGKWSDLMGVTGELQSVRSALRPRIRFAQSFTVPTDEMPVTGWPMALASWEAVLPVTGAQTVTIPPGATIDMLASIGYGLGVECNPAVHGESFKWSEFPPGTVPWVFAVGNGASLYNASTYALVLTPGDPTQTYFVLANNGATWGTGGPPTGPFVKAQGNDVVICSQVLNGFNSVPDGWAESSAGSTLLLYQNSIDSGFPAISWAGPILQQFNGTDSLQLNQRNGPLAGRAALAALPGGYALKVGSTYFATDQGPNGAPLWWTGAAWVDATGTVIP